MVVKDKYALLRVVKVPDANLQMVASWNLNLVLMPCGKARDLGYAMITIVLVVRIAEKAPEHVYLSGSGNSDDDEGNFRVLMTFIGDSERRRIDYVRDYVQEYPQYDFRTDLDDAFYNDDPYTGERTSQIEMPSGLIESGETFHICIDDEDVDTTLACYKLENSRRNASEELTIDFNNFP